jgi:membrane protease subunit HflK
MLRQLREQLPPLPPVSRRTVWIAAGVLAAVLLGATSYYQVEPDEVGVVQRLGRYLGTHEPGPHFRLPLGIDRVTKVPVQRQLKAEFGFRTLPPGAKLSGSAERELARESLMLTGDLNVAVVEWIVQYQIRDPAKYIFRIRNVESSLRDLAEASMRIVVGDHSVNEVLTTGRQSIADQSKVLLQQLANRFDTGVEIQQVVLQDVNPPDPVKPSFNEVNQAIQERERAINEAHADLNKEIPRARGEAEQEMQAAEGYAVERVNRARGEAERFDLVLAEYRKAPEVTRKRLYLETLGEVLPRSGPKVLVDERIKNLSPLLRLDEPRAPAAAEASVLKKGAER